MGVHQHIEDLAPFVRKGVWAADELSVAPTAALRLAEETLHGWLGGEEPQLDEAVTLLEAVNEQLAKWERIQECALGVTVRLRGMTAVAGTGTGEQAAKAS